MTFNYEEQYGVIVIRQDEKEQREIYERLLAEGSTLKTVTGALSAVGLGDVPA